MSKAEKPDGAALLRTLELAASHEGKTLGEWLYDSLAVPFDFTGSWGAPGKTETRKRYSRAAKDFAHKITAVLAGEIQ